ncbi:hypothetical protein PoB_003199300 [Plakobranchus ocellatus]|uniref:Uncharacterized protein n=1 Tax=Plakobranchus ocellatus TaxID=259542 RepID=A0AAV4AG12_9GAST|nr:hypothetical protein PoB_003199300 [Plakobranchus ocellatus]
MSVLSEPLLPHCDPPIWPVASLYLSQQALSYPSYLTEKSPIRLVPSPFVTGTDTVRNRKIFSSLNMGFFTEPENSAGQETQFTVHGLVFSTVRLLVY